MNTSDGLVRWMGMMVGREMTNRKTTPEDSIEGVVEAGVCFDLNSPQTSKEEDH